MLPASPGSSVRLPPPPQGPAVGSPPHRHPGSRGLEAGAPSRRKFRARGQGGAGARHAPRARPAPPHGATCRRPTAPSPQVERLLPAARLPFFKAPSPPGASPPRPPPRSLREPLPSEAPLPHHEAPLAPPRPLPPRPQTPSPPGPPPHRGLPPLRGPLPPQTSCPRRPPGPLPSEAPPTPRLSRACFPPGRPPPPRHRLYWSPPGAPRPGSSGGASRGGAKHPAQQPAGGSRSPDLGPKGSGPSTLGTQSLPGEPVGPTQGTQSSGWSPAPRGASALGSILLQPSYLPPCTCLVCRSTNWSSMCLGPFLGRVKERHLPRPLLCLVTWTLCTQGLLQLEHLLLAVV